MVSNKQRATHSEITVEQAEALSHHRILNRRSFLTGASLAGAAGSIALLSGCSSNIGSSGVMAAGPSETDVLNFALNLEYLEATFYSFATQGTDLPAAITAGSGAITGAPTSKIAFPNQQITDIFNEIFFNEMSHVIDLQRLIGSGYVARPSLNLSAAGAVTSANIVTIARQFEDVGTTAYAAATALLTGTNLAYAAKILAVEGFQAGALRLIAIQQSAPFAAADSLDVATSDPGAALLSNQGPTTAGAFFATSGVTTANTSTPLATAFARNTSQVLQIVYASAGMAGVSRGGFFPAGLNGNIATS